ncbi:MAG: hypothetical protein BHW14_00870 [Coprococcus sp. 43_8]|nr:MAG: hypothetical protein BHW14_00870 [Coprococcus sp. 43_8]
MVKVDWITLRNKEDKVGVWHVDQVNAAEDLKRICGGTLPDHDVGIKAEVAYIEFLPLKDAEKSK